MVLANGKLVEQGTHDELLDQKGAYHHLVDAQELQPSSQDGEATEERKVSDDVSSATDESIGPVGKISTTEQSSSALDVAEQGSNRIQQVSLGDENDFSFWELVKFIFAFNRQDARMMTIASLFCVLAGIAQPAQSSMFSITTSPQTQCA
jgi:ATP-binding cassette, subfamily B (MDR/TAP), member 1